MLGPVEVRSGAGELRPLAHKPTALLTAGLVDAGQVVSVDRLVDAVWGERPPPTAPKLVQSYVARIRQVLHVSGHREVIVTRPRGYLFQPDSGELDLDRFLKLAERGRAEAARGERTATDTLKRALALWHGPALGNPTTSILRTEAIRLEELRLATVEHLLTARLNGGAPADLVAELNRLVAEHPEREQLRLLLMTALHRCGRRAEALAAYRDAHRWLRTELGIGPSPELRHLHAQMLACETPQQDVGAGPRDRAPALSGGPERAPVPEQLPAATVLTGRDTEVERLRTALRQQGPHPAVCVVHGMPGVGKTALVLHVAHRLAAYYPGGRLYADLGGADRSRPVEPAQVITSFLHALGVVSAEARATLPQASAVLRTMLNRRRILIVLDNVTDERQARPLLPGPGGGSAVLIASRSALLGLDATTRTHLDVLDPTCAVALLTRLAGPERVAAEPAAAADIARLSGGLPLAVRVIGTRLAARDRWPLRAMAERLREEETRLDEMACGDLDVRARLGLSYDRLRHAERRMLRRLAVLDVPDFASWAAAALAATGAHEAGQLVERLADAHLLEPLGADRCGQVRYRLHDLVRLYARERAVGEETAVERRIAAARLVDTMVVLASRAGGIDAVGAYERTPPTAAKPVELGLAPGAWLEAEQAFLRAGVSLAERFGLDRRACDLASLLARTVLGGDQAPTTRARYAPAVADHPEELCQRAGSGALTAGPVRA
ncbi:MULTISPECIES: BTAD domain-containing putative transcriptional regulator [Streptomyces]|uniref:AfsR/SARP family transcriptional regulator n=1 Tax=Streptomyces TaxID=1883 RepID=UPI00131CF4EE|nr:MULTISPECIES: BTAD domain-containing putative transcriptional regulator [Streptomyces]MDI5903965.1 BTAD domain-containing putative transcriptional regulator [Streptomyces sp. 12257]